MTNDSAESLCQSFLQEAIVSSSGMSKNVHSLMLSIQTAQVYDWQNITLNSVLCVSNLMKHHSYTKVCFLH